MKYILILLITGAAASDNNSADDDFVEQTEQEQTSAGPSAAAEPSAPSDGHNPLITTPRRIRQYGCCTSGLLGCLTFCISDQKVVKHNPWSRIFGRKRKIIKNYQMEHMEGPMASQALCFQHTPECALCKKVNDDLPDDEKLDEQYCHFLAFKGKIAGRSDTNHPLLCPKCLEGSWYCPCCTAPINTSLKQEKQLKEQERKDAIEIETLGACGKGIVNLCSGAGNQGGKLKVLGLYTIWTTPSAGWQGCAHGLSYGCNECCKGLAKLAEGCSGICTHCGKVAGLGCGACCRNCIKN